MEELKTSHFEFAGLVAVDVELAVRDSAFHPYQCKKVKTYYKLVSTQV